MDYDELYDDDLTIEGSTTRLSSRMDVIYICLDGHSTTVVMSTDTDIPAEWDCENCGEVAILKNSDHEVIEKHSKRGRLKRSPWEKLLDRRSEDELKNMLENRMTDLREGKISKMFTV